jgi:hypothetical protein
MSLSLSTESRNAELKKLLAADEKYGARTWATLRSWSPILEKYEVIRSDKKIGMSNIYCYVGCTKKHLNIVTLNPLDVTRTTAGFSIPLTDVTSASIKKGLLRCSIQFRFEKESLSFDWSNGAAGTDMKDQKKNLDAMIHFISNRFA